MTTTTSGEAGPGTAGSAAAVPADERAASAVTDDLPGGALTAEEAWDVLTVLDSGTARGGDVGEAVLAAVSALAGATAEVWRAALRERCMVVPCWANPHALTDLGRTPGEVLFAGRAVPGDPLDVYVDVDAWLWLQERTLIGPEARGPVNLVAHVPQVPWPFATAGLTHAARWADELDSADPDVVLAAVDALNAAASAVRRKAATVP
ncbi:hypothetical protein ICW40_09525 [Actinotalea ferrariae]|uniref:hypothetical protein n=1 Tax=Actinotalea ferrariae TaxID=1386098 RepID=UPI001C8C6D84|nr:hypothetical protein [Actinotalea ferrariae]MBX9245045.1 hypothetical protein [Actinotalea ferrariae]